MLKKRIAADEDEEINWDDVADLAEKSTSDKNATAKDIPTDVQDKLLSEYERELIEAKSKKIDQNLKTQLKLKDKQTSPDRGEFLKKHCKKSFSRFIDLHFYHRYFFIFLVF